MPPKACKQQSAMEKKSWAAVSRQCVKLGVSLATLALLVFTNHTLQSVKDCLMPPNGDDSTATPCRSVPVPRSDLLVRFCHPSNENNFIGNISLWKELEHLETFRGARSSKFIAWINGCLLKRPAQCPLQKPKGTTTCPMQAFFEPFIYLCYSPSRDLQFLQFFNTQIPSQATLELFHTVSSYIQNPRRFLL